MGGKGAQELAFLLAKAWSGMVRWGLKGPVLFERPCLLGATNASFLVSCPVCHLDMPCLWGPWGGVSQAIIRCAPVSSKSTAPRFQFIVCCRSTHWDTTNTWDASMPLSSP